MEELKIEVDVKAKDDSARKTLDGLVKEYNDKPLEFQVKLGKFDISGISSSIARLTSDLNKLTNIEFNGLNKLETNLKNINKLMTQQNKLSNNDIKVESGSDSNIKKLVGDKKQSLQEIEELDQVGKEMERMLDQYNKNTENTFKEFARKNEDALGYIDTLSNSGKSKSFKKILDYKKELEEVQREMSKLGVAPTTKEKTFEMDSGKIGTRKYNGGYEDLIGQTTERFEKAVEQARKLSARVSQLKKNINSNLDKVSDEEKQMLDRIQNLQKDLKPVSSHENSAIESQMKAMLENYLSADDLKDIDMRIPDDIFKGYEKFIKNVKDIKKEFNDTFKGNDDFVEFKLFDNIQKSMNNVGDIADGINLDNLKHKLMNAFDIDENIVANIEKIEGALKQLNNMSELTQKSLFNTNSKSGVELELDNKIREYLELDKSINNALSRLSKAEFSNSSETASALSKEIELLKQKQALVTMDMRSNGGLNEDLKAQIRLQEELNRAISKVEQAEFRDNNANKLHEQALKMNQEFDEMAKKQREIASFEMPDVFDAKGIKSYVDYLDSAADGIKRILTQSLDTPGKDITTTLYGDGTEVRKVVNNIEKSINQLSTAYKQVDNELTRLIKSQEKLKASGDNQTAQLLDKQIASWREMQQGIESAAKSAKVYDQVMDRVQNTVLKNSNSLDTNRSQIQVRLDVDHSNAVRKVEEFRTKTLSNLQELERKYKGTQMFDQVTREVEKFKAELKGLDSYLENVENVDMSGLSNEFRRINQAVTQTKRDMGDLNRTMKNNFFDDLYDSMRTFTLGNLIGDAIQNSVYAIKQTIVDLDSSMRDMMKVAPTGFEGTSAQLKAIKNDAVEVAKATGKSTEDVIQGMSKALQTGAKTMSDAMEIAKSSATFANVGDLDQGQADKYIASIMSAYGGMNNALKPVREDVQGMGQDYNNLTKFLDLANHAGNNFAISTGDVGEALMRSGAVLSSFGVSMQDAISMIVGANESVQDAEKVGTAIKTMATNLGGIKSASKDGQKEFNRTAKSLKAIAGIEIYSNKQTGEIKDMMTILKELNVVWDDLGEDNQLAVAESIAGKNHINTLMAMMGNWETVLQYQEDYASGFTIGSAEREQERYLNSIEGKWNILKENMKSLVTTTVSSDFAKGFLDGAISFTDGLNNAFQFLDKFNATLPVTAGLITALGQSFKVLSGNGSVSLFGTGMVNGLKEVNKWSKGTEQNFSAMGNSVLRLSGNQTKLSTSTTKTSDSFKKYSNSVNKAGQGVVRINRESMNLTNQQAMVNKGLTGVAKGFKQSAVASKLSMVGTTLLNGALIGLATYGIGKAISAFDNYNRRHEIAAENSRKNIDTARQEISSYESQKKSLEGIADEYDKLAVKTNKTAEEMDRFRELKNEIAQAMPELVMGYDENNDPILRMNGSAKDLITSLDLAIDKKKKLIQNEQIEEGKNSLKDLNKDGYKGNDGLNKNDDNNEWAVQQGKIDTARKNMLKSLNKLGSQNEEKYKENIQKSKDFWEKYSNSISEGASKVDSSYSETQQKMNAVHQGINQQFNKRNMFAGFTDDLKQFSYDLTSSLDFSGLSDANVSTFVRNVEKALADGKIDEPLQKYMDAKSELEKTGQYEKYQQTMSKLTPELAKTLGMNEQMVQSMTQVPSHMMQAQSALDSYLMTFGKREQMMSFDVETQALAKQFDSFNTLFEDLSNSANMMTIDGVLQFDPTIEFSKDLPAEMQELISKLKVDGLTQEEVNVLMDISMAYQLGDTPEANKLLDDAQKQVDTMLGDKTVDIKNIKVDANFDVDLSKLEDALSKFRDIDDEEKQLKLLIDVVGQEKAELYSQIISELQTTPDLTNKLILENQEALSNAKSYEDVVKWLQQNPDIVSKYEIQGIEKVEQAKEKKKDLEKDGKATTKVEVEESGLTETKKEVEKLEETVTSVDGKEVEVKANSTQVLDSIEDIETLIKYSTQMKDGKYKLDIEANTEQAVNSLRDLEIALGQVSNRMTNTPTTTLRIETAQSAQNLSGLINRIEQTKSALNGLASKNVNINTALAAQNLSGLIARCQQYIGTSIADKTCNVHTAQASKNISGLIAKINQVNGIKPSPIVFTAHTAQAAKNISGLIARINQVPTSKTITFKMSQSGSIPNVSGRTFSYGVQTNTDIQAQTLGIQSQLRDGISTNPIDLSTAFTNTNPTISPILRGKVTSGNAMDYFNNNVNAFQDLEKSLEKIAKQLDIIDKKAELAFGNDKANLLKQQLGLLEKQQSLQNQMSKDLKVYQNELKYFLGKNGVKFDGNGDVVNQQEKLLSIEKQIKALDDKSANSKDDKAKKKYDQQKESLEKVKRALTEYTDISNGKIPGCTAEWYELQKQINDTKIAILEAKNELRDFKFDNNIENLENGLSRVQREISRLDKEIDRAFGDKKAKLIEKKVGLLKEEQKQLHKLANEYRKQAGDIGKFLNNQGFIIDDSGKIGNYAEQLEKLKDSPIYEYIKDQLDEFISIVNDKIPDAQDKWWDLQYTIEDCSQAIKDAKEEAKNFKIEIDIGKAELAIKKIQREIKKLDREIDKAFGKKKEELLNKKIDEMKKEQEKLHQLANTYRKQAQSIGKYLNSLGFNINESDGRIDLDFLEKLKDHKDFDFIVKQLEKYIELTQTDIPGLGDDWWDLQDSIEGVKDEIEEARKELEKFLEEAKVDALLDKFNDLQHEVSVLDKLMEHAWGTEKIDLMNKKLELLKQQQIELQKHFEFYNNKKAGLQGELSGLGFTFDDKGNITNYVEQLEKLANSSDNFDDIKDKLEEYLDIQDDKLPGITEDWLDLENAYKDAMKEQLKITKEVQDKIKDIYKKQVEERKKLIDEELKHRLDALSKEKDAYNKYRDEQKYQNNYEDQLDVISELQKKIDIASKDGSLSGQKKLQELMKQLEEEQKKLQEMVQDKIDSDINDMFDKELI